MSHWISTKEQWWYKCRRPVAHMTWKTSWFAARSYFAGLFSFIRLYNTRVAVMALYTCVLYSAQENLAEEKPIRTLNCKSCAWTVLFTDEKRSSPLFFSIYFFLYLFIYFYLPFTVYSYQCIHTYSSCFSSLLYYILFHLLCRDIVLSLANGCMSISWPVCCEWKTKSIKEEEETVQRLQKQFSSTFREYFVLYFERNRSDSVFIWLYIHIYKYYYIYIIIFYNLFYY